jgi:hypothetical protein
MPALLRRLGRGDVRRVDTHAHAADSHYRRGWQSGTALVPFTGTRWCRPYAQVAAATALTSFRRSTSACQGKSGIRVPRHQARRGRPPLRTNPPRVRGASAVCAEVPRKAGSLVRNTSRSGHPPRSTKQPRGLCRGTSAPFRKPSNGRRPRVWFDIRQSCRHPLVTPYARRCWMWRRPPDAVVGLGIPAHRGGRP